MAKLYSVWINGLNGRMGQSISEAINEDKQDFTLLGGFSEESGFDSSTDFEKADLLLDFSTEEGNRQLLSFLEQSATENLAVVIGTTGLSEQRQHAWTTLAKEKGLRLLFAPNTSLGILVLAKTAMQLTPTLFGEKFDIEIVETHHRAKRDAPSGTAVFLSEAVCKANSDLKVENQRQGLRQRNEVGVHAMRGGGVFGEHAVRFIGDFEEVTLSHRAFSRSLFAKGALVLGRWLLGKEKGSYRLLDIDLKELV